RLEAHTRALPGRAQVHEAARDRDLAQPRPDRSLAAELRQALKEQHHRVLEQVLGQGALADETTDEGQRCRRKRDVHGLTGGPVAIARPCEDISGNHNVDQAAHGELDARARQKVANLIYTFSPAPRWRNW